MDELLITKSELESAIHAVGNILKQPVDEIDLTDTIPVSDEVTDSNNVFKGKLSILFVDIRKSTDLTDELKSKKMVKIYRSFIRIVIQAIRYTGGYTRQFAGDGVMGVFQDSADSEQRVTSSQKAVTAARYIHTLIDFCLNPALKKQFDDICIGCGVGICTGTIMITKVGMRGKETDESAENETGIVWVGSTTNYANRYCSLAAPGEIFIDEKTYSGINPSEVWKSVSRTKGRKVFAGYVASGYYLALPDDFEQESVKSDNQNSPDDSFIQSIFEETQERALGLIDEISKKSAELSVALEAVKQREQRVLVRENDIGKENIRLQNWQQRLDSKQLSVDKKDADNKKTEYEIYLQLFKSVHCNKAFAVGMEKTFWEGKLTQLILCGKCIGLSEKEVKSEICYALVDLYQNLGDYDAAYYALCIQAETHPWIHAFTVEDILSKTYLRTQLKETIVNRLATALKPDIRKSLQKCLTKIK